MAKFLKRLRRAFRKPEGDYSTIMLSDDDIKNQHYKKFLGGGKEKWELRGGFQLFFLKRMGLQPFHQFFDIGCGPVRAGSHLIRYLEAGRYHGIDYNDSFIQAAKEIVAADPQLANKAPELSVVNDFAFPRIKDGCDFALVFSVLNHCNERQRRIFFRNLPNLLKSSTKVYISHATWFEEKQLPDHSLMVTKRFSTADDILPGLNMERWGWSENENIYPILELTPVSNLLNTAAGLK